MSWKDKLFTLINKKFYTKEELDSKATVVFIGFYNFSMGYGGNTFNSTEIQMASDHNSFFLAMELPFGTYDINLANERTLDIFQDDEAVDLIVNQKFMFFDVPRYIGEPQE